MSEQRRIGYRWNLRQVMGSRNLWKTTDLVPLLRARGISLSEAQIYRLVTSTPERIPAPVFAALCDALECTPNDLFEPYVEMRSAATANAPARSEDLGVTPGDPIARRIHLVPKKENE
ncbi:MAG: helix-turn-helix transcriptional regulator [Demequinaceae bacterium]|nr:helix-turn-helix transcriptional regulator [Demequinaceae bacterium]